MLFELTLVAWGEFIIEDDRLRQAVLSQGLEFVNLAGTDKRLRVGAIDFLGQFTDDFQTSRITQKGKFSERIFES
jgi:hypothetical protein